MILGRAFVGMVDKTSIVVNVRGKSLGAFVKLPCVGICCRTPQNLPGTIPYPVSVLLDVGSITFLVKIE